VACDGGDEDADEDGYGDDEAEVLSCSVGMSVGKGG